MTAHSPAKFTQLLESWLTVDWTVAQLGIPAQNIAVRNGLTVQTWDEDGWGTVSGFGGHLASGALISFLESRYLMATGKQRGPTMYALPTDVDRLGIEGLLTEALAALGIDGSDVENRERPPTKDEVESFKRMMERVR